jgi:hypothetical protein
MLDFLKTKFDQPYVKTVAYYAKMYILWIFIHYLASHVYSTYCTPKTFLGFLMSSFLTKTPHCIAARWIIVNGAMIIDNMWILIGVTAVPCLINQTIIHQTTSTVSPHPAPA